MLLIMVFLLGCNPPIKRFYIRNNSGESVHLRYKLADDLILGIAENYKEELSQVNTTLEDGQIIQIKLPFSIIYNRRYYNGTMEFEDEWIGIKDFISIFQEFSVTFLDNNVSLGEGDMKQEYIKYILEREDNIGKGYMLEIPNLSCKEIRGTWSSVIFGDAE
jgi:hypothetical protein